MGEQYSHMHWINRDTALRRSIIFPRNVKENGAAFATNRRVHVAVQNHDDVVKPVLPPHFFMARGKGKLHRSIVTCVGRIIAPAIALMDHLQRQMNTRARPFVCPKVDIQQFKRARWCRAITFAFKSCNARPSKRTRKREPAKPQEAFAFIRWQRPNINDPASFQNSPAASQFPPLCH